MALKAGTVGVNPDILDNSGRVKEIPAGDHDLSFEVDKTTGKAGYKIDGGDFHPFEEAGVTLKGWVRPANLTTEGLTPAANTTIADGGYVIINRVVYVDMVIMSTTGVNADTKIISGLPLPLIPGARMFLTKYESGATLAEALANLYMYALTDNNYVVYTAAGDLKFNSAAAANRYYHITGTYPASNT